MSLANSRNFAWYTVPLYCLSIADTQITAWVDEGLDKNNYIVPGLGDFGDR